MKLAEIRIANETQLRKAIQDVIKNQNKLTLGEIHATTREIINRAQKIGMGIDQLNKLARGES